METKLCYHNINYNVYIVITFECPIYIFVSSLIKQTTLFVSNVTFGVINNIFLSLEPMNTKTIFIARTVNGNGLNYIGLVAY